MDARLLRYYNQELRYLREMGGEFAREFPKIASRLGMEGLEVTDPYVERLLEGCAFLAARIQLKQDAEFPRFSQRLLELIYPNFLAPQPSMLVAQIDPVPSPNLLAGRTLPRDLPLLAPSAALTATRCEFRTTQTLELTPLRTTSAEYILNLADLGVSTMNLPARPRCGVRLRLALPEGMSVGDLGIDGLTFYLGGQSDVAMQLNELLLSSCVGVLVGMPGRMTDPSARRLPADCLSALGYEDEEAMLPRTLRGFDGVRVLQEYMSFPERFLFQRLSGLRPALAGLTGNLLEIVFLLAKPGQGLDGLVSAENFRLHCVPAINLFSKRADRIQVNDGSYEFHVVADRTAPLDYEVFDVLAMTGYGDDGEERRFVPLYGQDHRSRGDQPAYFTVWREPRLPSEKSRREGPRSGYVGSEVFVSLVDPNDAPFPQTLRQVALQIRCTNRDLPLFVQATGTPGGFTLDAGVPIEHIRVLAGPSRPNSALREGGVAWRLLNLLSLNYLSLLEGDAGEGEGEAAAALRELLARFPQGSDPGIKRQIEALQQVRARQVVRRHPAPGPIAFSRGIEIELTMDEMGHEGASAFLFAAALHQYLRRHASMNSFVETSLRSLTRGEIMRWKPDLGRRAVL